jgi:hypothetical protein
MATIPANGSSSAPELATGLWFAGAGADRLTPRVRRRRPAKRNGFAFPITKQRGSDVNRTSEITLNRTWRRYPKTDANDPSEDISTQ